MYTSGVDCADYDRHQAAATFVGRRITTADSKVLSVLRAIGAGCALKVLEIIPRCIDDGASEARAQRGGRSGDCLVGAAERFDGARDGAKARVEEVIVGRYRIATHGLRHISHVKGGYEIISAQSGVVGDAASAFAVEGDGSDDARNSGAVVPTGRGGCGIAGAGYEIE